MDKLLVLNANSKDKDKSRTLEITNAFVNSYRETNPYHEIEKVDLYALDLPDIDFDVMGAMNYLMSGGDYNVLGKPAKNKIRMRQEILDQFKEANKIVIAAPMWNFSNPSVLKKWIDCIVINGETFKYTDNGPVGLVENKKCMFIQTAGGDYSQMPEINFGLNHVKAVMNFIGIKDFEIITAFGMDSGQIDENLPKAKDLAEKMAKKF